MSGWLEAEFADCCNVGREGGGEEKGTRGHDNEKNRERGISGDRITLRITRRSLRISHPQECLMSTALIGG